MSTVRRRITHALAGSSALLIVMSSCDHACSTDAVERAATLSLPPLAVPTGLTATTLAKPPRPTIIEPAGKDDVLPPVPAERSSDEAPPPKPLPRATEIDQLVIEDGHTSMPTSAEWLAQKPLHTSHAHCFARVVREWMSIHCLSPAGVGFDPLGIVRVLAGDETEVQQWTYTEPVVAAGQPLPRTAAAAVFPVRRGDRRLLEIVALAHGAHPRFDQLAAYTISVAWLEGMQSPDVTVTSG